MRAIDADACESYFWEHLDDNGMAAAMNAINDMPTIEPEIVRCKDCMYWVAHDKRCVYLNHGFAPNMWCCHGRRTDEV